MCVNANVIVRFSFNVLHPAKENNVEHDSFIYIAVFVRTNYQSTGGCPGRKGRTPVIHSWITIPKLQKSTEIARMSSPNVCFCYISKDIWYFHTSVVVLFAAKEFGRQILQCSNQCMAQTLFVQILCHTQIDQFIRFLPRKMKSTTLQNRQLRSCSLRTNLFFCLLNDHILRFYIPMHYFYWVEVNYSTGNIT